MADTCSPRPVLLVVAAFSRHAEALAWARTQLEQAFGVVGLTSVPFVFDQTSYYEGTMGPTMSKQFFAFHDLVSPDRLAEIKLSTNALERTLAEANRYPE